MSALRLTLALFAAALFIGTFVFALAAATRDNGPGTCTVRAAPAVRFGP